MSVKSNISIHYSFLYFCFTLGGCLFLFGKCGLINAVISLIIGVLSFIIFYYTISKCSLISKVARFLISFVAISTLVFTFCEFAKFTSFEILIYTPRFLIISLFVFIITVFSMSKEKAILKFCLVFGAIMIVFCLSVFIAGLSNFSLDNFECLPGVSLKEIIRNYLIIFFPAALPLINRKDSLKSGVVGIGVAGIIFVLFSTFTVCTFGFLNEKIPYPILALCDTVNSGRIFTRLGYFFYFVIYICGLIRATICIKVIKTTYSS